MASGLLMTSTNIFCETLTSLNISLNTKTMVSFFVSKTLRFLKEVSFEVFAEFNKIDRFRISSDSFHATHNG